jgi:hypothetical protein
MSFYNRFREPLLDLNATLKNCTVVADRLTRTCQISRKPFVLYSKHGEFIARYGSLETATAAARQREEWAKCR